MKKCVYLMGIVFVLLAGANGAQADLTGLWKLQVNVVTPIGCQYEDGGLYIRQAGTFAEGTANLLRIGAGGCPQTLMGMIKGTIPLNLQSGTPFSFFYQLPQGPFTIAGAFTNPNSATGTFSGTYLGTFVTGTWILTSLNVPKVPTSTPWGLVVLIALVAGSGAAYFLKKRRMAVS